MRKQDTINVAPRKEKGRSKGTAECVGYSSAVVERPIVPVANAYTATLIRSEHSSRESMRVANQSCPVLHGLRAGLLSGLRVDLSPLIPP